MINKEIITRNAITLFKENGYDKVTIQDICDVCEISKPTFYSYIKAKENLILGIYDNIIQELLNDSYKLILLDSSYEQFVYIFSKLIKDTKALHYDLVSQLFIANFKENKNSFTLRKPLTQLSITILKQSQDKGEILNIQDPSLLYKSIAHLYTGFTTMWCINQGQSDYFDEFFTSLNTLLMVKDEYKDIYKKYQ